MRELWAVQSSRIARLLAKTACFNCCVFFEPFLKDVRGEITSPNLKLAGNQDNNYQCEQFVRRLVNYSMHLSFIRGFKTSQLAQCTSEINWSSGQIVINYLILASRLCILIRWVPIQQMLQF